MLWKVKFSCDLHLESDQEASKIQFEGPKNLFNVKEQIQITSNGFLVGEFSGTDMNLTQYTGPNRVPTSEEVLKAVQVLSEFATNSRMLGLAKEYGRKAE